MTATPPRDEPRDSLAAHLWEHCEVRDDIGLIDDDPRNVAAHALTWARDHRDELLAVAHQDVIDESQRPPGPPIGLTQVVPPTFAAYQSSSEDILDSIDEPTDPVANLRATQMWITRKYACGGVLPGPSAYQRGMQIAQGHDVPPEPVPTMPTRVDDLDSDTYDALRSRYAWLEQRHRDTVGSEQGAVIVRQAKEIGDLRTRLGEYDTAIGFETTCLSCSRVLASSYEETVRAEKAEEAIARVRELHRKNDYFKHADECDCPDKDSIADHDLSEIDGDWESYCLLSPARSACAVCTEKDEHHQPRPVDWPCDTIRAIDGDAPKETTT